MVRGGHDSVPLQSDDQDKPGLSSRGIAFWSHSGWGRERVLLLYRRNHWIRLHHPARSYCHCGSNTSSDFEHGWFWSRASYARCYFGLTWNGAGQCLGYFKLKFRLSAFEEHRTREFEWLGDDAISYIGQLSRDLRRQCEQCLRLSRQFHLAACSQRDHVDARERVPLRREHGGNFWTESDFR